MVKTRSAESMPYPVIKENSRRHFLNSLFSDGGSWLFGTSGGSAGLLCLVALSLFIGMTVGERGSDSHQTRELNTATGARAQRHIKFDFRLDNPHLAVRMFLLTTFIHAHCQGRDHRKFGSWEDEPPWPGAYHPLLVCPRLTLRIITAIKYVSGQFSTAYRSTIGTDFITKTLPHHSKPDESVTLQIWVSHHRYTLRLLSLLPQSLTRP